MSKALKPCRLDVDPTSPKAAKEWKHWKRTFDNFITECGEGAPDKFRSIFNFVSSDVFEYVVECATYDEVETPNTVFASHQLASRKQKPGENLDEFLEELKKLSKNCNFVAVSAEVYRSEMTRDSFINGLSSSYICQRLLESAELTLEQAHDKARTLDLAQKNSEVCSQNTQPTVAAASTSEIIEPDSPESQSSTAALRKGTKQATRKK